METRDLYKQKYEARIQKWKSKVEALYAESEERTAQAQIDIKPHVDAVQASLEATRLKFAEISGAADDRWDDVAKEVDGAWADLKAAAGGAYDALKRHERKKKG